MTPRPRCPHRPVRAIRLGALAALAALGLASVCAVQAADVGVSISISQPGVYGRVDIGRFPQPTVVLQQPVLVAPRAAPAQPVYLWVPPGHRQHWRQHCARYNACGAPVYFVREDWYQRQVMGHDHRDHHGEGRHGHGERGDHGEGREGREGREGDRGRGEHGHRG